MKKTATLIFRTRNLGIGVKLILTFLFLNFVLVTSSQQIKIDGLANSTATEWTQAGITHFQDLFGNGVAEDQFATGSKDWQYASDWRWAISQTKGKNDLANCAAAILPAGSVLLSNGSVAQGGPFLVFAGDRTVNNGDAQIGFWFFQDGTAPRTAGDGTQDFFPQKHIAPVIGDILVLADFTGGGRDAGVTVLEWTGGGGNYAEHANFNLLNVSAGVAENNAGATPVPSGWLFPNANYATNQFFEGYVNLAAAGAASVCFSRCMLEGRSSQEITAQLDDFIGGPLGSFPNCNITGNNTICTGSSACFSAYGGPGSFTYHWSGPGGVNVTNTTGLVCNLTAAGTYNVTVSNATGCTNTCNRTLTVHTTPVVTVNSASICAGSSATLTASHQALDGTPTYAWSNGANTQTITVSPGSTTVYSVTVTNFGCSGTGSGTVTVNPNPTVTVNSASICLGGSTTLTATPNIAVASYAWSTGATTQTITVSPGTTTGYSVTVTTGAGCKGSGSGTVTVNPNPTVTVNSAPICLGGSTTLTASPNIAVASYLWAPGGATTQTITVSPAVTTSYTVTVTTAAGCSGSGSGTVTVNPNPTVTVNSPAICNGTCATLTASPSIAVASYLWSTGATTQTINVCPTSQTTYNVTVTTAAGCKGSGSGTVTVNSIPEVSVNSPAICNGSCATLTATTNAASPSYLWSTGATTQTINVCPTSTTGYSVTVTSGPGCVNSASGTVTVNPNPTVTVNSPAICNGSCTTLTATPNISVASYLWSTGATTQTITVCPTSTTGYSVTVTTGAGCKGSGSGTVTVNPNPTVTVNSATICAGSSTTLTATPNISVSSYAWSTGATTQTINVSPASQTTYTVTVTTAAGCKGSGSGTVSLVPNASAASSNPAGQCRAAAVVNGSLVFGVNIFSVSGTVAPVGQATPQWSLVADNGYSVTIVSPNSLSTDVRVGGNKNGGNVVLEFKAISTTTPKCADAAVNITLVITGVPDLKQVNGSAFCPNVTNVGSVTLLNSQSGVSYQLKNDVPQNVQAPQIGNGGTLTWYNLPPASYTVEGTFVGTVCSSTSGPATVTENQVPDPSITPVSQLCTNASCVALSALPAGGTFSGTGVSNGQFCPATAGAGTHTINYCVTNDAGCTACASMQITVIGCEKELCTYTQGYFGNPGGLSCDGTKGGFTTYELIEQSLKNWGGTLTLGATGTCNGQAFNRTLTITTPSTPDQIDCVIDKLPGGGPAAELSGASNICTFNDLKNGRINNVLLAQTMALGLNIGIGNPQQKLGDFDLQEGCLYTAKSLECGGEKYNARTCEFVNGLLVVHNEYEKRCFSKALIDVLDQYYTTDVSGLFALANDALGNKDCVAGTEHGLSLSEIAGAAGSINEVFDECRISVGWNLGPCVPESAIAPPRITVNATAEATSVGDLKISAYPNPFRDQVRFLIQSPVAGQAVLEVYNVSGQKLQTIYNGRIGANETKVVNYKPMAAASSMMIYRLRVGNQTVSGKLVGLTH